MANHRELRYIITAFAGPKAAESFYEEISWRWGFGIFCIILPVVALPLFILLKRSETNAKKLGLLERPKSGRSLLQSIWYYLIEFDSTCNGGRRKAEKRH